MKKKALRVSQVTSRLKKTKTLYEGRSFSLLVHELEEERLRSTARKEDTDGILGLCFIGECGVEDHFLGKGCHPFAKSVCSSGAQADFSFEET